MQQVKGQDAQFIYMATGNNLTHVTGISIFDPSTAANGKVTFDTFVEHVKSRQQTSPLYTRRLMHVPLEMDYPYWVDDEYFDIEYHIRQTTLPTPGNWNQFCDFLSRYHSSPLDMNRPPWEMMLVYGLDDIPGAAAGCFACITKIHHVAVDGASAISFFSALSDIDAEGTPAIDLNSFSPVSSEAPTLPQMMKRALVNNVRSPIRLADTVMRAAPSIYNLIQSSLRNRSDTNKSVPHTRFNGEVSPHKTFDATSFELAAFKNLRSLAEGATINDIVLAVCSGALRRYLIHHNELPKEPLVAWVPINKRSSGSADGENPGNNISAMTAAIHSNIEDPVERVKAITATTKESKEAKSGISARLMTDITKHIPAATQLMAAKLVLNSAVAAGVCNLFISNVPGPQMQLYMAGARQVDNMAMAPLGQGMGLFIATPSYAGKISFSVTSTRDIMPDIGFFVTCLQASLDELSALVSTEVDHLPKKTRKKKTNQKRDDSQ